MGAYEPGTPVSGEALLGYHPCNIGFLTSRRDPAVGQCQARSLTGAVASERVSAVSYTHLDVYKRQEDDNLLGEYTINYKKTHSQTLLPMLDAVSYTHLDVYKRQAVR